MERRLDQWRVRPPQLLGVLLAKFAGHRNDDVQSWQAAVAREALPQPQHGLQAVLHQPRPVQCERGLALHPDVLGMLEESQEVPEVPGPVVGGAVALRQQRVVVRLGAAIPAPGPGLVRPTQHERDVGLTVLESKFRDFEHNFLALHAAEPVVVVHEAVHAVLPGHLRLLRAHGRVAEVVVAQPPSFNPQWLPYPLNLARPQERPLREVLPPELVVLGNRVVLGKVQGHGLRRRRYLGQPQGQQPQGGRDVDLEQRLLRVFAVRGMAAQLQPQRLAELHDARRRARPQVELPPPSPVHATHDGHSALPLGQVAPEASQPGAADGTVARRLALEAPLPKPRQDVVRARFVGHHGAQRGHQAKRPFLGEQSLDRVDLGRRAAERLHRPPRHVGPLVGAQQQRQIVGRARGLGLLQLPGEHLRVGVAGHLVDARLAEHRE
mmetsp:Transcript_75200/g.203342  ORF Transcript_75200/g.203342 Transcript_75200/m.203342 type:complete len:437 (-) Transcript_75200:517-1827(-)